MLNFFFPVCAACGHRAWRGNATRANGRYYDSYLCIPAVYRLMGYNPAAQGGQ